MEEIYAILNAQNDVVNVIVWDGNVDAWQPPAGHIAVKVPEGAAVSMGYHYQSGEFVAPPAPPAPPPTTAEVLAQRDALLAAAALRIAPLSDAVALGDATAAEEAALKAWRQYRVKLSRIEQQSGFPASVVWPDAPQ